MMMPVSSENVISPTRQIAATPLYSWHGAVPLPLSLGQDQSGWSLLLTLQREGELLLMPVAWDTVVTQPNACLAKEPAPMPAVSWHTEALDAQSFSLTLGRLINDGWQVVGCLHLHHTGANTRSDFNQLIERYLWQKPAVERNK
jgi:hypothetical protein